MIKIDPVRFLLSVSRSLDFTYTGLLDHHKRVAYLSQALGRALGLSEPELWQLFKTAIIHDAGATTWKEKNMLLEFEINEGPRWAHCRKGYEFAHNIPTLDMSADEILVHHDRWMGGNPSGFVKDRIPLAGRIIHLVDRIDVLIQNKVPILQQRARIMHEVKTKAGTEFDPNLVELVHNIMQRDSLWLDLVSPWLGERLMDALPANIGLGEVSLVDLARLFARVVDAKSPFTYRHSKGVASSAVILGQELGFNNEQCELLEAAALLHDLGKVTIPEAILDKNGPLTANEFNFIKQHTYYTYWLLKPVTKDLPLAQWAAFHHERLDGNGYPFQKVEAELSLGARIVAAADVFTALREDRPYRLGMQWPAIEKIFQEKVADRALDKEVVETLLASREKLDIMWEQLSKN
jgi:HD-GYP domain-containing protein (c-di-GMP phosphodiesterase class II)